MCSYTKTKPTRKGGVVVEGGGDIAIELRWINAPARGSEIVGKLQLLTLEQWSDYDGKKMS